MKNSSMNPETLEDFIKMVEAVEGSHHTYETIADSLTDLTVAFFNYFASKHGMTGWQASWAQLQFIKKTRNMEAPFMIVDSSKLLYPQYDILVDVERFLEESKPELAKIAQERLDELKDDDLISLNVLERWKEISKGG